MEMLKEDTLNEQRRKWYHYGIKLHIQDIQYQGCIFLMCAKYNTNDFSYPQMLSVKL